MRCFDRIIMRLSLEPQTVSFIIQHMEDAVHDSSALRFYSDRMRTAVIIKKNYSFPLILQHWDCSTSRLSLHTLLTVKLCFKTIILFFKFFHGHYFSKSDQWAVWFIINTIMIISKYIHTYMSLFISNYSIRCIQF